MGRDGNFASLRVEIANHLGADPLRLQLFKVSYSGTKEVILSSVELHPGTPLLDEFFDHKIRYGEAHVAVLNFESAALHFVFVRIRSRVFPALTSTTTSNPFLPQPEVPVLFPSQDPSSNPRKRMRTIDPDSEMGFYARLRNMYWGEDFVKKTIRIERSGLEFSSDDIGMTDPTTVPYIDLPSGRDSDKLMVREEYEIIYKYLIRYQNVLHLKGTIVCGHPGIGEHQYLLCDRHF